MLTSLDIPLNSRQQQRQHRQGWGVRNNFFFSERVLPSTGNQIGVEMCVFSRVRGNVLLCVGKIINFHDLIGWKLKFCVRGFCVCLAIMFLKICGAIIYLGMKMCKRNIGIYRNNGHLKFKNS
jgi:hypothetical protein